MKMKKMVAGLCAVAMLMPIAVQAKTMEFTMGSQDVYVSDEGIEKKWVETAPYTENDRTLVPVRIIGECFGATVGWDEPTQTVTIDDGANQIKLVIGSSEALVNGEVKYLDVAAKVVNDRTMVPLRFISENLGKDVEYIEATEQILIDDEAPVMTVNGYDYTIEDVRFLWTYYEYHTVELNQSEKEAAVRSMLAMLERNELFDRYALENGYDLSFAEKKEAAREIMKDESRLRAHCLLAPGVKFYEKYNRGSLYLQKQHMQVGLEQLYQKHYVCAKHILIRTEGLTKQEKDEKWSLAESIRNEIVRGADFDELCKTYGEDPGVAENPEGYVFAKGEMVPEFEAAAFALEVGQVSQVIETAYGYHIIKREPLPKGDTAYYSNAEAKELAEVKEKLYPELEKNVDTKVHKTIKEIAAML